MAAFCVVLSWLSIKGRSALEGRHLSKCQQLIHHWLNTIRRFAMKHARAHTHTHTLKKGNMPIHTNIRTTATFTKFTKSQMAGKQSNRPPSDTLQDWHTHAHLPLFQLAPDLHLAQQVMKDVCPCSTAVAFFFVVVFFADSFHTYAGIGFFFCGWRYG